MKLKEIISKINFVGNTEKEYLDDEIDASLDEEISDKDRKLFKKLNKKVIAAMVAAALIITAIVGATGVRHVFASSNEAEQYTPTVEVIKQDVQKTLSATGTIISAEESGQFATVSGSYPVEEVYVKVGDVVKKGDPLYKLDMSTMEETLSYQQQALNIQNQQNDISKGNAERALQSSMENGAVKVNEANASVDDAKRAQKDAADAKQKAIDSKNAAEVSANSAIDSAKAELDAANAAVNSAKAALDSANANKSANDAKINEWKNKISELEAQKSELSSSDDADSIIQLQEINAEIATINSEIASLGADVSVQQKAYNDAVANANAKQIAYNNAVNSKKVDDSAIKDADRQIEKANQAYNNAVANVGNTQNSANEEIANQYQAIKSSDLSAQSSTLSSQQEIAKSKEELSKAVVCASQDGTVTNVNIVKGQTYSGTDAVVIDNVTNLKATADIDEGQIPQIAMGQKVQIKTDATGDDILEGTVTFVSPTATKNSTKTTDGASTTASVSKSRATYRVDVSLDNTNENLRLGMTAKMTFITASAKDALVVPSSDIQTDADGNKYVVVQKANGTTENVTITTGISDDFYTEIKEGTIKEGDTILEAGLDGSADAVLEDMGADGGIYFE